MHIPVTDYRHTFKQRRTRSRKWQPGMKSAGTDLFLELLHQAVKASVFFPHLVYFFKGVNDGCVIPAAEIKSYFWKG